MAERSLLPGVFVLLSLFPGSLGDNYNIGGLVASSIVSFFAFVAMMVMLILVITWNQWYPQFMKWRGLTKQPRPVKPKFDLPSKQNGTHSIHVSTKSMSRPSSIPSTPRGGVVSKVQNGAPAVYSANPTDTWIQEIQSSGYEEKVGQISFDEEEVIVTELVKDTTQAPAAPPPSDPPRTNGLTQSAKADDILLTLEKQPMESEKTTSGVMDFHFGVDDDAVVNLSGGDPNSKDGEMVLY